MVTGKEIQKLGVRKSSLTEGVIGMEIQKEGVMGSVIWKYKGKVSETAV